MNRLFLLAALAAAALLSGCKTKQPARPMPPPRVEVTQARLRDLARSMTFTSQLYSNYDVAVQARVNGFLLSRHFEKGLPVRRGQLLFRIDPAQLQTTRSAAEAALAQAKASLLEAENNYRRAVPLSRINAISQSSLDQYAATYASAQAAVKSAQAQLSNAGIELGYATVYAPIDGIIGSDVPNPGDYVGPGTQNARLATISNVDTVSVRLSIPVTQYLRIRGGTLSEVPTFDNADLLTDITMILSDGSVYPYAGKYDYTEKDVGDRMGTIVLAVNFPNPDLVLKPGQYASIRANVGTPQPRVVVPQRSISQNQDVNSLWVMRPDSTVEFRKVTLGDTFGTDWVVTEGLVPGETVLVTGLTKVHSGEKVQAVAYVPEPDAPRSMPAAAMSSVKTDRTAKDERAEYAGSNDTAAPGTRTRK